MRRAFQLSRPHAARLIAACFVIGVLTMPRAEAGSPRVATGQGGTTTAPRGGPSDDTFAYAVPRNAPDDDEVALPRPLPPSAVAEVKRILALQAAGEFAGADQIIARLDDDTLIGPILAARYLSPRYQSSSAELLNWYEQYNDQPEAPAVYGLLRRKPPPGAAAWMPPRTVLMPDPGAALPLARPGSVPDNAAWRRDLLTGIADWRRGDAAAAAPVFARAAGLPHLRGEERAGAAFWAARVALRLQQPDAYFNWLRRAMAEPTTFYGILAGRLLGQGFGPSGLSATLSEADVTAVDATPDGHLAFALLQVGQADAAETALRALWPQMQDSPSLARAVMAVAARAGLEEVAAAIAAQMPQGDEFAGMALPMPALHPAGGFTVDPPLVYALARTESGFNASAASPSGAQGLMQLMPGTADAMRRRAGVGGATDNPAASLALGQAYLRYLAAQTGIDGNLLAILASYNAGPAAAAAWHGATRGADPLVFIETIPNPQTRRFVTQVLADSWLYAEEIGTAPASLDALAQGRFPTLDLTESDLTGSDLTGSDLTGSDLTGSARASN